MSRSEELQPDELELVSGGSQKLFSSVSLGAVPSHNYGLISDSFGANMSYNQANTVLQQFNAPTRDGLYGQGNDPNATFGVISRPGAQDLHAPYDWGGNVTLQHGDGYAINTTIEGQHPLEGTITRNLVTDFHDGGGYQVLTLGQGQGGAALAAAGGGIIGAGVGGALGGWGGAVIGGLGGASAGQNGSHLVNPGLGDTAFSQLDNAMLAYANGTHNPNLDLPSGRLTELGYFGNALAAGTQSELGLSPTAHGSTAQQETLYQVVHDLNSQGPVTGSFGLSSNDVGVYHFTPEGTKYYEMQNGHAVEKQVDEFSGVDAAVQHQAALNADHPQSTPEGEIHLPDPPAPITDLPPELTPPHDGNGASGSDHTDNHGVDTAPADTDHASAGPPADTANHAADAVDHSNDAGFHVEATDHSNDAGFHVEATDHSNDAGFHVADTTPAPAPAPIDTPAPAPVDTAPPAPVVIDTPPPMPIEVDVPPMPVFEPPPVIEPPPVTGAYSDTNPIPVVPPVDPGADFGSSGGGSFDFGGVEPGIEPGFDGGFSGGFDGGGE